MASGTLMEAFCFPFFISLISLLIVRWLIKTFTKPEANLVFPPTPPALPIIGHNYPLSSKLPQSLQTLARRYGPLMQIRIGSSTFVVVSNVAVAKEIFITHDLDFGCRYEPCPAEYNIYSGSGFMIGPYG
ncbi:putative Cytochrome P450 [Melia azedarach]|uniref:Cytochrome P450 n=1 Tax=Melia azedarach TaxID=155640 RepID=A0ACC1X5W0_MELAZ|nr:putative Cytochrome P450 [Melia azedarach]